MHIRRAAVPATPEADASSGSLALLPLLSLSVLVVILLFFSIRWFKRSLHLPSLTWLRGKGQGAKRTLGLSGVELLPTSHKSIPTPGPSPYAASFKLESNAGKDGSTSLLSRSSSLDGLPQFVVSSPPPSTSPGRSHSRSPFTLSSLFNKKRKPLHRRSKSLGGPVRHLTPTSLVTGTSAPPTPSPQALLIDFSTSGSSSSTSSDLGTRKFRPGTPPLISGIPVPLQSPVRPTTHKSLTFPTATSHVWAFDQEDDADDITDSPKPSDPLLSVFKRSYPELLHKAQPEPELLIQYERSPSPSPLLHAPSTPTLAPKRFGTANPFASLTFASASPDYISQRPLSPSPLSLSPSSPPGIELVPVKSASTSIELVSITHAPPPLHKPLNLVDFGDDEEPYVAEITHAAGSLAVAEPETPVLSQAPTLHNMDMEDMEEQGMEEERDPDAGLDHAQNTFPEATETHVEHATDPFDDAHAINLSEDPWSSPSPADGAHSPSATPPQQLISVSSPPSHVSIAAVLPSSPLAGSVSSPRHLSPESEPRALTASWQWDDSWSPALVPAPQHVSGWPLAPLTEVDLEARDVTEARGEMEDDLISFDGESAADVGRARVAEVDVEAEMDPADAWFVEEPTAVWDLAWSGEDGMGGSLFEMGRAKEMDEQEQDVQIRFLDGLLAGPSGLVDVHVFEEPKKATLAVDEAPHYEDQEDESNDIHDTTSATMKSVLSTPTTPNTPLPPLLPPTLLTTFEEHPDPDLLPLPELPLSSLPLSPVPLSPQPLKPPSPSRPLSPAQTPTPPASPPPTHHVPTRPLWSLRAADAPPLGLPASAAPSPRFAPVELQSVMPKFEAEVERLEDSILVVLDEAAITEPVPKVKVVEEAVVTIVVDAPTDEPQEEEEEEERLPSRPPTPKLTLSTSLPGSFPSSPATLTVSLPAPAPAHLSLLPRAVATPSSTANPSTKTAPTARAVPASNSNRLRAPRSALDLALAMQLRPGLGAGADPAWMVRFLMVMFGWVAVLVSGDI